MSKDPIRSGDIVVFNIDVCAIPLIDESTVIFFFLYNFKLLRNIFYDYMGSFYYIDVDNDKINATTYILTTLVFVEISCYIN